jgi:hypothetical protein
MLRDSANSAIGSAITAPNANPGSMHGTLRGCED